MKTKEPEKSKVNDIILASLGLCLLAFMMFIGCKVYRVIKRTGNRSSIKSSDKIVLLMLLFINLDAASISFFHITNVVDAGDDFHMTLA